MRHGFFFAVIAVASAGLIGLSGCARFQDEPLSAEKSRAALEVRTLTDPGLKSFLETNLHIATEWPLASWDFTHLCFAAFYYHPDLDVVRAQLGAAKAARVTAGERPNPTVSWSPGYNTTVSPAWILGGSFDIPLETMGKRGYRVAQAAHLSDAARFNLAATAWQVRSRVRKSLVALYGAVESEALLRKQDSLHTENVRLVEAQLQAGSVSSFEVTQSRIALNQTRFALHDAEKQSVTTRAQLAEAIGIPLAALDGVKLGFDDFQRLPGDVPDMAARRQALVSRADILGALAEYAAAQSALQLEIAKQYPNLHLSPGYQLDQTDNKWSLGLMVELPVLNQNQGAIAEATAKRAVIAAKFNALQARVLSEIEQAVAGYRAALKKAGAAESLNIELQKQLRAAQGMLAAGEISRVELGQRQLELTAASLAQLDALVKAQESLGALEDALQSPTTLPLISEQSPRALNSK